MRKLVVSEFMTVDGVIEAPENWQFPFMSEDMQADIAVQLNGLGAMLFGRTTYNDMVGFWPTKTDNEFGIADKMNSAPKYVISTTLDDVDWNNTTLIKDNAIDKIAQLKQQNGDPIGVIGSATLARALIEAGLVDEFRLCIHPVVVGHGKRLFNDGLDNLSLKLVDSQAFTGGVVALTYQVEAA